VILHLAPCGCHWDGGSPASEALRPLSPCDLVDLGGVHEAVASPLRLSSLPRQLWHSDMSGVVLAGVVPAALSELSLEGN